LKKVGVYCAYEWLLTGSGMPPRNMDEVERSMFLMDGSEVPPERLASKYAGVYIPPFLDEDVRRELSFFISLHERAIFHIMEESFLNGRYRRSDCVAGVEADPQKLVGEVVIGQEQNGKTVICRLLSITDDGCSVFFSKTRPKEKVSLSRAAEILWHRRSLS
ncbi:MAG: hypothetical protein LBB63_02605, partial [Holosporaceae bacterium]|nr:hypothetical protein [Holosporaceae bacterium]